MKTIYVCDLCGEQFNEWEQCYDHEREHIKPEAYNVRPTVYRNMQPYPILVSIPMSNGAICQYIFDSLLQPPLKKEEKDAGGDIEEEDIMEAACNE